MSLSPAAQILLSTRSIRGDLASAIPRTPSRPTTTQMPYRHLALYGSHGALSQMLHYYTQGLAIDSCAVTQPQDDHTMKNRKDITHQPGTSGHRHQIQFMLQSIIGRNACKDIIEKWSDISVSIYSENARTHTSITGAATGYRHGAPVECFRSHRSAGLPPTHPMTYPKSFCMHAHTHMGLILLAACSVESRTVIYKNGRSRNKWFESQTVKDSETDRTTEKPPFARCNDRRNNSNTGFKNPLPWLLDDITPPPGNMASDQGTCVCHDEATLKQGVYTQDQSPGMAPLSDLDAHPRYKHVSSFD
ncbi:hypothetical protein RRG08_007156 [Elysia crispata]|uniref:Uncharacterized protein n=1 Tax=Elysia crispata TaxID=231223 RepID=A0AAE1CZP5_9GAST|nr:hypothetical protein RRG08_007156 [Elysia crispata]